MLHRTAFVFALFIATALPGRAHGGESCVDCHAGERGGFNAVHAFGANNCAACHAGDPEAPTEQAAHDGLIVHKTRAALDDSPGAAHPASLQSMGHGIADSLLRKQCASCHLGQRKRAHALDVTQDRGGGCLACHVNEYPEDGHPALTTRVDDGRCFGCHSRSGRIALSYTGLAEIPPPAGDAARPALRLADGRAVERLPADVHYIAGMSCIDCHTSVGLMGDAGDAKHQREAVDIACTDCHGNAAPRVALHDWPAELASMKKHVPFATDADTRFLATRNNGTPLWHIEERSDGAWLHTKNTGRVLRIPAPAAENHARDRRHERLTCAACHSQWAPQCFGCHMEYDPGGEQWDHVARSVTPGRWNDRFWHADNGPPALGVNGDNRIEPFVPGMIMTVAHPAWDAAKFLRQFAPLSPHTTGASRSCVSCHRSDRSLGLGDGDGRVLQDGLPADAWTNGDNSLGGRTPLSGQRPFTPVEMRAIRDADLRQRTGE